MRTDQIYMSTNYTGDTSWPTPPASGPDAPSLLLRKYRLAFKALTAIRMLPGAMESQCIAEKAMQACIDLGDDSEPQHPAPDEYLRGYKARLDEEITERPEPKHPTLYHYFKSAWDKQVIDHTLRINRRPDGGFDFYIHPSSVSGDTQDYILWDDPFTHEDMLVNKLNSPTPDTVGFKKLLEKMRHE